MATFKNTKINRTDATILVNGTTAQQTTGALGSSQTHGFRYNTTYNNFEYYASGNYFPPGGQAGLNVSSTQSTSQWYNPIQRPQLFTQGPSQTATPTNYANLIGQSSSYPAMNAQEIKAYNPSAGDGVYWINVPTIGAVQVYCLMNQLAAGGGWMMAMKMTRGSTFTYGSSYWTSNNTLNDNSSYWNQNDGDAKMNLYNYYLAKDIMAVFPDLSNGGSIPGYGQYAWVENNFNNASTVGPTYGSGQGTGTTDQPGLSPGWATSGGSRITLLQFFNQKTRYFIQEADTFVGGPAYGQWSSQNCINFYGFNWNDNINTRWGFGYNENGGGMFPNGANGSDDISAGIGTPYYSAGDQINCCQNRSGVNRSVRCIIYVR
jgi:hypothetical protein